MPKGRGKQKTNHDKVHDLEQFHEESTGEYLTTNQGLRINDDQNSLKAGARGPSLLEDFHFREKITHFDHERIPERIVHARGAAAHGYFQVYESLAPYTKAKFLQDPGSEDAGLRSLLNRRRLTRRKLIWHVMCAALPSSSTPRRAITIWLATTSLSSSSKTRSSFRILSTPSSRSPTTKCHRGLPPTTRSGISFH